MPDVELKPTPYAPRRCAKCDELLPSLPELAAIATRARAALEGMRVALPSELTVGVRQVASALRCYAGLCAGVEGRTR